MDLLPLQDFGRSWQGCQLIIHTCSHHLIYLIDLIPHSNYSFKPYFVDSWLVFIEFTGSAFIDSETCPWVCLQFVCGRYPNQLYIFDLLQVFGRSWWWCRLCDCTCHHQLIDWLQVNILKLFLLIVILISFSGKIRRRLTIYFDW